MPDVHATGIWMVKTSNISDDGSEVSYVVYRTFLSRQGAMAHCESCAGNVIHQVYHGHLGMELKYVTTVDHSYV